MSNTNDLTLALTPDDLRLLSVSEMLMPDEYDALSAMVDRLCTEITRYQINLADRDRKLAAAERRAAVAERALELACKSIADMKTMHQSWLPIQEKTAKYWRKRWLREAGKQAEAEIEEV